MLYKQNTFLDQNFMIRAISPSLRYVVEGFFCTVWISLEPYIIDLSRFYKKSKFYKQIAYNERYGARIWPAKVDLGFSRSR